MKKILFVMLSTLMCVSLFAYDESADVVYSADSLSAEVKIGSAYFDGGEHFVRFYLPQNATVKVTQINSCYIRGLHDEQFHIYVNDDPATDLVSGKESHMVGVFVDTIVGAQSFTVWFDNFYSADYSYNPKDPAFTIRYAVINERTSTESILLNGDVEIVSGALTTSGYQNFMGTKVTAILGDDYNEYTCFGSSRGGMIRGSNEGYLILSGNPNGYGNRNVYINRYTAEGNIIMTASSGKVGIGVDDPKEKLHINGAIRGNGVQGQVMLKSDSGYITIGSSTPQSMEFVTDRSKFTFNKPLCGSGAYGALQIKSSTGNLDFGPMDSGYARFKTNMAHYHFDKGIVLGNGILSSDSILTIKTNYSTHAVTISTDGLVGIGTTNPTYRLDVAGTIRANEIIVNSNGADFVFAEDYQLRPLSEVKAFITENKHLPEIKSAQEMQENGVGINELQTQLLQKIEELTLYILQQEERIKALEAELNK